MTQYEIGTLVFSRAGHDKDNLYVIISEEPEYVFLADGKIKTIENPKKKNKKHIQVIHSKIETEKTITNEDIKRGIKLYKSK
ncbi:KOW domain-containing RNA-binding protein [Parasporobacterium paucivorans]|uniref:Ribosomal protein L14E/L6E/L27E n=1 Tax=Parasporobacterium paucivorans DSM 15970 TaxID=1122934 RepID=A0A1M6BKT3_9FIRM|nr:KOW domain-containing RNA-binding protein [Parasporobacterium paucivorans]SHI49277.1 hypothetical protein SAMN02745691_00395 [Parasporobacterium paucivorans DSM 15970]